MKEKQIMEEWVKQAEYDFKTAEAMFSTQRYIYAVFMAHLSLEKLLKALYFKILKELPPKTHDLLFLISKSGIEIPSDKMRFLKILNNVSIPTRYPQDLNRLLKVYNKNKTKEIIAQSREVLKWLKSELNR